MPDTLLRSAPYEVLEIRSIAGSFARLMNRTVRSIAPVSLKDSTKKLDSSNVIPIAANTTAKFSSVPRTFACLAICAASLACGRPDAEKIGGFCPRTSVFSPSIADTPVWMNSSGYASGCRVHRQAVDISFFPPEESPDRHRSDGPSHQRHGPAYRRIHPVPCFVQGNALYCCSS